VFTNLIDNAAKFTPEGGRISVTAMAAEGTVNIDVRDTGIGLPADQLQRIFDPFTQLPDLNDPSQSGLGLGLSLVRGLTELHGGTVHAASAGTGQGSCFTVRLRAAQQLETSRGIVSHPVRIPPPDRRRGG
jgi:signal transduction histidine kinase